VDSGCEADISSRVDYGRDHGSSSLGKNKSNGGGKTKKDRDAGVGRGGVISLSTSVNQQKRIDHRAQHHLIR